MKTQIPPIGFCSRDGETRPIFSEIILKFKPDITRERVSAFSLAQAKHARGEQVPLIPKAGKREMIGDVSIPTCRGCDDCECAAKMKAHREKEIKLRKAVRNLRGNVNRELSESTRLFHRLSTVEAHFPERPIQYLMRDDLKQINNAVLGFEVGYTAPTTMVNECIQWRTARNNDVLFPLSIEGRRLLRSLLLQRAFNHIFQQEIGRVQKGINRIVALEREVQRLRANARRAKYVEHV